MNKKAIEGKAQKLHETWCRDNAVYLEQCRKAPNIYRCSRDFTRSVPWDKLPDNWLNYYRREARFQEKIGTRG